MNYVILKIIFKNVKYIYINDFLSINTTFIYNLISILFEI